MNGFCYANTPALSTLHIANSFALLFPSGMFFGFFYAPNVVNLVPCLFWICVDIKSYIKFVQDFFLVLVIIAFPLSLDYIIYFIFFWDFFFNFF